MLDAEHALAAIRPAGSSAAEASVIRYFRGAPGLVQVALSSSTCTDGVTVVANHGRWIVECPDGDGGAQFASKDDRRFMCVECMNAAVNGEWRPTVWPDDLEQIESILDARPVQENQNWSPGQTAADLVDENGANS